MSFSRGDVVAGAFEVERSLASDAEIDVCRARHLLSGKRFALKVLRLNVAWCEAVVARATKLDPIAVESVTACIHQGAAGRDRWYFAFEWVSGGEPENRFPRRAIPARAALIGARLASALATFHELRAVHGHVRPERIVMVGKDASTPKLLDFVVSPDRSLVTANARYVAPELLVGGQPTAEADVYALGVILWELLAGRPLSAGESRLGVFLATLFDTPDPALAGDFGFASWITRMMAPEPLERPEARQVEAAFYAMVEGQPVPLLATPSSRDEIAGRADAALAVLAIRPPAGKDPSSIGLGDEWRRDIEGLGAQLTTLPDGTLLGRIRGHTAHAVATAVTLVATATQEQAFRASVVSGLLHEGGSARDVAASRAELLALAALASRTPAGVTRFTARLAAHVGASVGLKPSGDSYLLVARPAPKPKRGGTLEIELETKAKSGSTKKRKVRETELDGSEPRRSKGGTLVLEPEPGMAAEAEPRRGKGGTLVLESEPPRAAASNGVPVAPATSIATLPDDSEDTRVGPLPSEAALALEDEPPREETPTLEIEVSDQLVELSRTDMEIKPKPSVTTELET